MDFGRKQILLSVQSQIAADITLLGLGPMMQSITGATEAFAGAMGHGRTDLAPTKQRKALVANCSRVFPTVYNALDWHAEYGESGADREQAIALQVALKDLAAKYPVRLEKTKVSPVLTNPQP